MKTGEHLDELVAACCVSSVQLIEKQSVQHHESAIPVGKAKRHFVRKASYRASESEQCARSKAAQASRKPEAHRIRSQSAHCRPTAMQAAHKPSTRCESCAKIAGVTRSFSVENFSPFGNQPGSLHSRWPIKTVVRRLSSSANKRKTAGTRV